jgi:hypothetical protein
MTDDYEKGLKDKSPEEVAGYIISNFPSVGFCSSRKRIYAFQLMAYLLELYKREGGDFVESAAIIISTHKPARKAYLQAVTLRGRFRVSDLDSAGFDLIGGYGCQ